VKHKYNYMKGNIEEGMKIKGRDTKQ